MKILSLFDGMACGYEALLRAGIPIDKYYASEIDKYAIQIALKNHPDIIEIGDVTQIKGEDYKDVDIIMGGSPCQGFSMAGKMLNFDDPRSKLFFEFVRLVREIKPKYFLLENVKMKKEWQDIISRELGVEPIEINSALVSAQSRKRLYRTNIPGVSQPEDKGILLKDILEKDVDEKYYLTEKQYKMIDGWKGFEKPLENIKGPEDKIGTLTTHVAKMSNGIKLVKDVKDGKSIKRVGGMYGQTTRWGIYDTDGVSPTITASAGMGGGHVPMINVVDGEVRVKQATKKGYIVANDGDGISLSYPNFTTRRGRVVKGKSNTLTTQGEAYVLQKVGDRDKNNFGVHTDKSYCLPANPMSDRGQVVVVPCATQIGQSKNWGNSYGSDKAYTLRSCNPNGVIENIGVVRKLTPEECERLQTLECGYTSGVSNSQRYKMLGNGRTVDVIAHILSFIK